MQFLTFEIGGQGYGLDFSSINEVIPLVEIRKIPHVPDYISGVFNYRDKMVPVIDLCILFTGKEAQKLLSTRIIIINYFKPGESSHTGHLLGFIAERVTETISSDRNEMQQSGISNLKTRYLGDFAKTESGTLQQIIPEHILPEELQLMLFNCEEET
jgi:chemotaxis-related protein WspB